MCAFDPITWLAAELFIATGNWIRLRFFNPTREWPPSNVSKLSFDIASHTLNGVRLDSPLSEARILGPADRLMGDRSDPDPAYQTLGLIVECYEGLIVGFRLIMDAASRELPIQRRFKPALLTLTTLDGSLHTVSRETTEETLFALFGKPVETDRIVNDRVHRFIVEGNSIDTYHDPDSGRLVELTLERFTER